MEQSREVINAKSFINNEWMGHSTTQILSVTNKYDHKLIATIPYADASEVQFAISNSVQGFQVISKMSAEERKNLLLKMRDGLILEKEKFVNLIVTEAGKPLEYARAEVDRSIKVIEIAAEEAVRITGEVVPMGEGLGIGKIATTKRFPMGPILAISPYNFPLNLALHKIAPAIASGCSIILKPSPFTPLTALALGALCKRIGLPSGVLNVVVCKNEEAELMLKDERIKMLSFTGSAEIGWKLKSLSGKKKVILELGGNAAVIVDKSSNVDEAVKAIVRGAYLYSGQVCISVQRIFVDQTIFDQFIQKMSEAVKELKWGNPSEENIVVSPIIDKVAFARISLWVEEAKASGAQVIFGGHALDEEHHIYAPTLLTNTNGTMKVNGEEVFGPVAIIEKVQYFDEVIREVNRSKYGLQAGLFTNQLTQIKYAHENLEVGALIINNIPGFRIDSMPYGGVKDSGLGREGVKYAIEEMTEPRLLVY
jgi:glyceraldehyde-3-phosphate dehydrogenase (NADP+)